MKQILFCIIILSAGSALGQQSMDRLRLAVGETGQVRFSLNRNLLIARFDETFVLTVVNSFDQQLSSDATVVPSFNWDRYNNGFLDVLIADINGDGQRDLMVPTSIGYGGANVFHTILIAEAEGWTPIEHVVNPTLLEGQPGFTTSEISGPTHLEETWITSDETDALYKFERRTQLDLFGEDFQTDPSTLLGFQRIIQYDESRRVTDQWIEREDMPGVPFVARTAVGSGMIALYASSEPRLDNVISTLGLGQHVTLIDYVSDDVIALFQLCTEDGRVGWVIEADIDMLSLDLR